METAAVTIFWISAAVLFYVYIGYPLHLFLLSRLRPKPACSGAERPHVTIVIPAYNEAANIAAKLENTVALDYPADRWDALVASDGSDDGTNEIVETFDDERIRLLALPRQGKNETLNAALQHVRSKLVFFTDADSMVKRDALACLVRWFADPRVGGVAGNFVYAGAGEGNQGERAYWNFDRVMKRMQSMVGSVTSATGQVYAIRRACFRPVPQGVADDFFISAQVVASGRRMLFEPDAIASSPCAGTAGNEFRRKVRVFSIGLRGVWTVRALCNPFRYGFYAVQLVTQKVLRRLVVAPLVGLLLGSVAPAWNGDPVYAGLLGLQVGIYALGLAGILLRGTVLGRHKLLALPCFFMLANAAAVVALWNIVRSRQNDLWNPQREPSDSADGAL
jgi:hypothetical protein